MTTEEINAIWNRMKKLHPKNQDMIVKKILREIEEAEWNETLTSPESLAYNEQVLKEIEEDIATGNIQNYLSVDDLEKLL